MSTYLTPTPIDSASKSGNFFWTRINWDKEGSRMSQMSNAAGMLYFQLRACSWNRNGIPVEDETFKRILRYTCRIGFKRFQKLWPELEDFFVERDGRLYNIDDEEERLRNADISGKRKEAASLGAKARWSRRPSETPAPPPEEMPNGIPVGMPNASVDYNNRSEKRDREEVGHQLPLRVQVVEEAEVPPSLQSQRQNQGHGNDNANGKTSVVVDDSNCHTPIVEYKDLSNEEYAEFCEHCANPSSHPDRKAFTTPGRKLAERIKAKFKMPISTLPKFAWQQSAAMWESQNVTIEQVDRELARLKDAQSTPPERKSSIDGILREMNRLKGISV